MLDSLLLNLLGLFGFGSCWKLKEETFFWSGQYGYKLSRRAEGRVRIYRIPCSQCRGGKS